MLRVKEVAAVLNVHTATVYRLIESGDIKAVRSGRPRRQGTRARGGAIRIPEEALKEHLAKSAYVVNE
ncbi:helix-turn-helix domain-containing protein [Streptomyces goshikiensis]|uniref:helix-turn-helix domain-containing protein n=1 Tax=Streptomyces goshikiensis TaxID=1942 RepID=UPI0036B31476